MWESPESQFPVCIFSRYLSPFASYRQYTNVCMPLFPCADRATAQTALSAAMGAAARTATTAALESAAKAHAA
jgi:hypothetical protein